MLEILTCEQNSEEWFQARMGLATASRFKDVMSKGRGNAPSKTRQTYLMELASEIVTGEPMSNFSTKHTDRGHEMEPDARRMYEFINRVGAQQVGFIKNDIAGCSPDSLIGEGGALEIKTKIPALYVACLLEEGFPQEHYWQCMGILAITGRQWIDLAVYWPGFPLIEKRLERDEEKIAELIKALVSFNAELDMIVSKVRNYGRQEQAA